jgi:hypothetical protein
MDRGNGLDEALEGTHGRENIGLGTYNGEYPPGAASITLTPTLDQRYCNDPRFCSSVRLLGVIYRVALYDSRKIPHEEISLQNLLGLRLAPMWRRIFRPATCRPPRLEEWKQIETKTLTLMSRLESEQIKKVQIKFISNVLLEQVALGLLVFSITSLIAALAIGDEHRVFFIACFTCWLGATGALGATAFIYINALSIQVDPTVDITSRTLVIMRLYPCPASAGSLNVLEFPLALR